MSAIKIRIKGEAVAEFEGELRNGQGVTEVITYEGDQKVVHGWPQGQVIWYEIREQA